MGSLETLPRTAGGRRQNNAASVVRKVPWSGQAGDKEKEANMSQWQWVDIDFTRRGILDSCYPVEDSRHASGQCLDRSHSDEHRFVSGLCFHLQWSEIATERLTVWWAKAVRGSAYPQTKGNSIANSKIFCVCRNTPQNSYQSQGARSGDIDSLSRKEIAA